MFVGRYVCMILGLMMMKTTFLFKRSSPVSPAYENEAEHMTRVSSLERGLKSGLT